MYTYGVDFSGAMNAGKKIWISTGIVKSNYLHIEGCFRINALSNTKRRDKSLESLVKLIGKSKFALFGFDFPFSIPEDIIRYGTWEQFISSFYRDYPDEESFKESYWIRAGNREKRRLTEIEKSTPFSSYNLRIYKQTYYGIRDLLEPIVRKKLGYILPMEVPKNDKPWIFEVCPASTLKKEGIYLSYKGNSSNNREAREKLLNHFEDRGRLVMPHSHHKLILSGQQAA